VNAATDTARRAAALRAAGRSDDAILLLRKALATAPDDEDLLEQLARAQLDTDTAAAHETALRLVAIAPQSPDAHYVAALAAIGRGHSKKGLEHAENAVALAPWWAPAHAIHAEALARRARKQKQALAAAERAIELDPHSLPGYIAAGNAELARAGWREAETWFRRALELDPHNRVAQGNLVIAHEAAGRLAPAFADTSALLRFDPRDADAREQLDELVRTTLVHVQWLVVVLAMVGVMLHGD
jgi:superkiller protein 3